MARLALLPSLFLVACTAADDPFDPPPDTVRDRLANDGAALAVAGDHSTGSIVARLWSSGWEDHAVELSLGAGDVIASADAAGDLRVDELSFALAPIDLSAMVFDEPTRLVDLHVALAADPPPAATTWHDGNSAAAATTVTLRLSWSLEVGDRVTPLGPLTLTNLPLSLTIAGSADHVEAGLALDAEGTLWSWAGLIELGDLSLSIMAR